MKRNRLVVSSTPSGRGFLLLVVIGMLAVLLTICVGFLSYTRGEAMGVASQRNKGDTGDIFHSAMDWCLANISNDLMDSGSMDERKNCAFTVNPGGGAGGPGWWFRPLQTGTCAFLPSKWGFALKPTTKPSVEAPFAYLPADFFPGGGVRGRFTVQVFDLNACINVNDWNEDCNPSQCQMAHMIADGYGFQNLENFRRYRDTGIAGNALPHPPIRYQEAWRVGSHTARYLVWPDWNSKIVSNTASPNWVTGNTSWLTMYGPQYSSLSAMIQSDGLPMYQTVPCQNYLGSTLFCTPDTPNMEQDLRGGMKGNALSNAFSAFNPQSAGNLPWCMSGFVTQSGCDPDTGRCPVNINSCYNSGEILPFNFYNNPPVYTMEAVWNVESLRRIIKVGEFWTGTVWKNAQIDWNNGTAAGPAAGQSLTPAEKMIVERLKLKLAYQYQETLCRYFTGTYAHAGQSQPFPQFCASNIKTYAGAYPAAVPAPLYACTVTDYSAPRFPVSLKTFRKQVHDDFLNCLTKNYINPAFVAPPPATLAAVPAPGVIPPTDTDGVVHFDKAGNPQIAQGKLDMRTACACYDNMVPGKPPELIDFSGCTLFGRGDPIYELFVLQLARQEDVDDPYQIDPVCIRQVPPPAPPPPAPNPPVGSGHDGRTLRKSLGAPTSNLQEPPFDPRAAAPTSPGSPWPIAAASINNIYKRWADNPLLSEVSYFANSAFPDPYQEVQCYDHAPASGVAAQPLSLLPKGNDICSRNAITAPNAAPLKTITATFAPPMPAGVPIPTGPWLDGTGTADSNMMDSKTPGITPNRSAKQHDVPWRQMCFSPDSFSTELTTTSTTFMLIINAQLVEAQSVAANPGNPALHSDVCWNQWGVVVEVAPDILADPSTGDPNISMFPTAGAPNPAIPDMSCFWQWYKNEMPRKTKTYQGTLPMTDPNWLDDSWLDDLCPSLATRNTNNTARYTTPFGATNGQPRMPWKSLPGWIPPLVGGAPDQEHSSTTIVRDWKKATNPSEVTTGCDIHQVPPAGVPSGRGADKIYDGGANQIKKRVIIRSIWCLNEGIEL